MFCLVLSLLEWKKPMPWVQCTWNWRHCPLFTILHLQHWAKTEPHHAQITSKVTFQHQHISRLYMYISRSLYWVQFMSWPSCFPVSLATAYGPALLYCWCSVLHFLNHHSCTLQPNYALDACISGCGIFSTIEYERGTIKPLDNLKNCNYSKYILLFNICALVLFWTQNMQKIKCIE